MIVFDLIEETTVAETDDPLHLERAIRNYSRMMDSNLSGRPIKVCYNILGAAISNPILSPMMVKHLMTELTTKEIKLWAFNRLLKLHKSGSILDAGFSFLPKGVWVKIDSKLFVESNTSEVNLIDYAQHLLKNKEGNLPFIAYLFAKRKSPLEVLYMLQEKAKELPFSNLTIKLLDNACLI